MKRATSWVVRFLAAGAIAYGGLFVYVLGVSRQDGRRPVDAIIVLGAAQYNGRPSDVLRARLDHAVELYTEDFAPLILVTGGMAEGDIVSEATVSRQYLVGHGVRDTAVVVIPVGRNSRESVASSAEWLVDRSLQSVLLVSDPFHIARLRAEANAHGLESWGSPTRTSPISTALGKELRYLAAEAVKLPVVWTSHLFGHE